jgi:hypothetical protein
MHDRISQLSSERVFFFGEKRERKKERERERERQTEREREKERERGGRGREREREKEKKREKRCFMISYFFLTMNCSIIYPSYQILDENLSKKTNNYFRIFD